MLSFGIVIQDHDEFIVIQDHVEFIVIQDHDEFSAHYML